MAHQKQKAGTVKERVKKIIADQLTVDIEEVKDDSSFIEDLGTDSLDRVEIIVALEEEFSLQISDEDAEESKTVGEAIALIQKLLQKTS